MATDRYGNPITTGVMDNSINKRAIQEIRYQDFIPEDNLGDGESRGYEGGTVSPGTAAAMGLDIGQKAMGFAGRSLGPAANIGINATEGMLEGKDVESIGTKAAISGAKAVASMIGGIPGAVAKAGISIGTAEDPAQAAKSMAGSTIGGVLGGMVAGPLGMIAGSVLGDYAASNLEDIGDAFGDMTDSRDNEVGKDALEDAGWDRSESRAAFGPDATVDTKGTGGFGDETARQEMSRRSGISSSGLGTDAAGDEGGGGGFGDHDSSGGMGGASDRGSEAGGMGGV